MKTLYKYFRRSFILLIIFCNTGCDFVEIDPPTDKIITSTLFQDEGTATSAVLGLYAKLVLPGANFSSGGTTLYTGLASDELYTTNPALTIYMQFENNQIAVDNGIVYTNFWRHAYEIIYHANLCLEGLDNSENIGKATKEQLMGESYFIRAFCYWYLVNLFGDVPLALTTDHEINRLLPKVDSTLIMEQILADLTEARNRLPVEYPTEGKVRANYYTVLALLIRYYLYEENWAEVERLSTEIIEAPSYSYEDDIDKIFLIESNETIWQLESGQPRFNSVEGAVFIPLPLPTFRPTVALTKHLVNAFESGDTRKTAWVENKTVLGTTYPYPFKYKIRQNTTKTENYVLFRLGEVYLNRAEAYAHLGRPQEALNDLNIIRMRANLPERTLANTTDVVGAVLKERRIELFAEWGHRWFDLKRTGVIDQVLGTIKTNWQPTAAWFPIPQSEILSNPNLTQNQGYNN